MDGRWQNQERLCNSLFLQQGLDMVVPACNMRMIAGAGGLVDRRPHRQVIPRCLVPATAIIALNVTCLATSTRAFSPAPQYLCVTGAYELPLPA